ncbi:M28 family metallopeptidase, partial [Eisenbergiella sp.]
YLPIIEDGDFELPCGIVLPENLPLLDSGIRAVLKLDAERKAAKGANVIASYGSGAHKVCFSAHIDTGNMTPGALDNASGTAVLLAMASQLQGKTYPYRLEFVLFNGEDYYSTPGEMAYLASHLSRPEDYVCAFNVDGAGLKGKDITYSFYECPEKLSSSIRSFASRLEGFSETEPWPQGDHTLFSFSGVPAVAITSSGIFELTEKVLHTEKDIPALVDTKKLGELAAFLLGAV